jgi:aryl-alcohol dehydrogenase (NADP+)
MAAADLDLGDEALSRLTEASAPRVDDYPYGAPGREQRHRSLTGGR